MKKLLFLASFSCMSLIMYAQHEGHNHDVKAVPVTAEVKPEAKDLNAAAGQVSTIATPAAEQTLLLKEEVYDFGKIPQGKPVTHIFEVTNTGKTALKIGNVQASCGCTTPVWDKDKDIPAGENSKITVGYNAAAEGPFTKLVTITYNETLTKQITIKGEVWKTPASSAPVNSGLNDLKN
jgi:hypothetical protein